jgi:hypothetical protein
MSKKMMLLALAALSAAAFALPAGASAAELHLTNVTKFSGTFEGGTLTAENEPVIKCEGLNHVEGTVSAGGTTGTISLDYTKCRALGFLSCKSGETAETIKTGGTFHLITGETVTLAEGTVHKSPAILVTPEHTTITCSGIANPITVTGNVIGTITSPKCGGSSNELTISFNSNSGTTQEHKTYTGVSYNLTYQTGTTGTIKEAGLTSVATVKSTTVGTLDCT